MARAKTVEQQQIEDAPIVEQPEQQIEDAPIVEQPEQSTDDSLATAVQSLIEAQYGNEGEPEEGVERWDDMVREMVIEADKLEVAYRDILAKKEANRTLLRAFRDMGKVPTEIPSFYYPERKRKTKAEKANNNGNEGNAS